VLSPYRVPAIAENSPARTGLGTLHSLHRAPFPWLATLLVTPVVIFLCAMIWEAGAVSVIPYAAVVATGLVGLVLGEGRALVSPRIGLYEEGLAIRRFGTTTLARFEEVRSVTYDFTHEWLATTIVLRGKSLSLGKAGSSEIATALDRRCGPAFLAFTRRALASGDRVSFGRLTASADGLDLGGMRLRWSMLYDVRPLPGRLEMQFGVPNWSTEIVVPLSDLPNAPVLIALLAERAP
jgi:hypothetical protein